MLVHLMNVFLAQKVPNSCGSVVTDARSQQSLPQHSTTTSNMEQSSPSQLSHLQSLPPGVLSIMLQQLPVQPQL